MCWDAGHEFVDDRGDACGHIGKVPGEPDDPPVIRRRM
jgi:hypothetical protein